MKNPTNEILRKGQRVKFLLEKGGAQAEGTIVGRDRNWWLIAFDKNHSYQPWVSTVLSADDANTFGISDQYMGREARWACVKDHSDDEYITEILPGDTQQVKDMTDIKHREVIHGFDCFVYENGTDDSYCIAVGPFQAFKPIKCVGDEQSDQTMAHHPMPEAPGCLSWENYFAQFSMCSKNLELAKQRLREMADAIKEGVGERKKDREPTWSCFYADNGEILLVRNPAIDEALVTANALKFKHVDYAYDASKQGEAWENISTRWGKNMLNGGLEWTADGKSKTFDLSKIVKCDQVQIVDENGTDIKGEYLVTSKLQKAKEVVVNSAKTMGGAGAQGLKLAGARRMNITAYNQAIRPMFARYGMEALADDPKIKAAIMMSLPLILHPLAGALEEKVPYAKHVKGGLELSFTETVRDNSDQLMEFAEQLFKMMYIANNLTEQSTHRIDVNYDKYNEEGLKELAVQRKLRFDDDVSRDDLLEILTEHDQEQALMEAQENEKQARVGE